MRVEVKFFAVVRDRAGVKDLILIIPQGSTIQDASKLLALEFPTIESMLPRVAYAVNQSYAPITTVLQDGDELAIIPPVSGG